MKHIQSQSFLGKTVYILGAGASYHCGAPLLRDFMPRARSLLLSKRRKPRHVEEFKRVFDWIDALHSPAYFLNIELENLEHVFSLLAMRKELGYPEAERLYEDLHWVVYETLEQEIRRTIETAQPQFQPDETYLKFIDKIIDSQTGRLDQIADDKKGSRIDSIITFNYDVLVDLAILNKTSGIGADYCLDPDSGDNSQIKLLKLHGSLNWGVHLKCSQAPVTVAPYPWGDNVRFPTVYEKIEHAFTVVTNRMKNEICPICKEEGKLVPLVIPPTWSKVPKPEFRNVWKTAVEELKHAAQIVIIGYSMPATDTFLQYLMALAFEKHTELNRVLIFDPDCNTEQFKNRYKQVFSKALVDRNKVQFHSMTFEQFIQANGVSKINSWEIPEFNHR